MPSTSQPDPAAAQDPEAMSIPAEARYRALFEAIDAGFCIVEVLFGRDDQGEEGAGDAVTGTIGDDDDAETVDLL